MKPAFKSSINRVCMALKQNEIFISPVCTDTIREFSIYRWDNDIKRDAPKKENDHAMDDIRYFDHPDRFNADIMWFTKGYVEYIIPNLIPHNQKITQI